VPELPEVETVRRGLSERIVGRKIVSLSFDWQKSFQGDKSKVENYSVERVERRAKTIQIHLSSGYNLLFHLKMTGQLIWRLAGPGTQDLGLSKNREQKDRVNTPSSKSQDLNPEKVPDFFAGGHPDHDWHAILPNKHTRIIFDFDDGSKLFFNDLRKFGWCKVLTDAEIAKIHDDSYGLEPIRRLDDDSWQAASDFTVEYLMQKASKIPNRNAKQFLLDQTIIAGIGNIYADETLFLAKVSPLRKVKDVTQEEWRNIHKFIISVLEKAIKYGGTTDSDYVNVDGKKGGMQNHLNVYHLEGRACQNRCGGEIKKIKVGGRGTHYCPNCQK
jgi:formamidopyrimidine-DNA glycosylase